MKNNWSTGRMDKFFDLRMGKTPPRDNPIYWDDPANNWVAISDMGKSKYISMTKEQISDNAVSECRMSPVPANTAIMSFKLSIGKAAITAEPIFTNEAIMSFIPKAEYEDEIITDYIYYYLLGFKWSGLGNKAVMGVTLNKKSLSSKPFAFPSISLQNKIVAELDQINDLIAKNRELLSQLDVLAQSLFYYTFGDPISNQKGWAVYDIKSITEVLRDGPFGSNLKSSHYTDSGIRVIRLQNIGVGYFDDEDKAFISEDYYPNISKYTCYPGDVILGTLGNPNLRACIVPPYLEKAIHKADCVRLVPDRTLLESKYVEAYFNNPSVLSMASKDIHGATRARISCGQIAKFLIPVPPLALQEDFAAKIKAIEAQKAKVEAEIAELQTLLDARMDYWFN